MVAWQFVCYMAVVFKAGGGSPPRGNKLPWGGEAGQKCGKNALMLILFSFQRQQKISRIYRVLKTILWVFEVIAANLSQVWFNSGLRVYVELI